LVLVLAVLTVSYASSMRAYLQQRSHIATIKEQIADREADLLALEREKRRWEDPTFVQIQARKRFGYVLPGETGVQVIDIDGNPLGSDVSIPDASESGQVEPTAWWSTAWESMEIAGHPPKPGDAPADKITAPVDERPGGSQSDGAQSEDDQ
jgi:Septum formation initiator